MEYNLLEGSTTPSTLEKYSLAVAFMKALFVTSPFISKAVFLFPITYVRINTKLKKKSPCGKGEKRLSSFLRAFTLENLKLWILCLFEIYVKIFLKAFA